ncbi:DUF6903 family protein [Helcococcus kunzii]|uniref:DUF6903 family protein n=1 Tax=Helcococcus kunzii TaxID=40091 RepID=UPI0038A96918
MDYYKKIKARNIILTIIFLVGIVMQFIGHRIESTTGLFIQLASLAVLILVLLLYNRRYK